MVTSREVARGARSGPEAVGIAAARAGYAGVATATAAAAARTAASTWPVPSSAAIAPSRTNRPSKVACTIRSRRWWSATRATAQENRT